MPQKSFVYPIAFDFDDQGKWSYASKDDIDYEFTVRDSNETITELNTLNPTEGKYTLGVILAPDGGNSNAVTHLRKKADQWAVYICTGHINQKDAWTALDSTILKTLRYPLPALTLSQKQCKHIMAPVLQACLPKTAIARNYPHDVVYGPKEEGGLNKENLYIAQGTSKISLLSEHLALPMLTGELLRCSLEAAKVEIDIGRNLFSLDFETYSDLCTDGIIKHIWKFSSDNNIHIEDRVTTNLSLQRDGDVFIMEAIAQEDFTSNELQHINRCRLHLQVTTLSDIMEGHGNRISKKALNCIYDNNRGHHYQWPIQPRPHQRTRRIWKRALKKAFPREQNSLNTAYTLGLWLNIYNTWKWYFNPCTRYLYKQSDNNRWSVYRWIGRAGRVGRYPKYRRIAQAFSLPIGVHRATVTSSNNDEVRLTGWAQEAISTDPFPPIPQTPDYLKAHLQSDMGLELHGNSNQAQQRLATALQRREA